MHFLVAEGEIISQARVGDQSFWRESKKLLSMAEIEKAMHPAALSEKYQTKKKSVTLFPVQQPILPFQLADLG